MRIEKTRIPGCVLVHAALRPDARGWFVKPFVAREFAEAGLCTAFAETFVSYSRQNVLRGLHFQLPPADHDKLVCCVQGEVLDAIVDLRVDSPTFRESLLLELTADQGRAIYIPRGCAHGFYVRAAAATVLYHVTSEYSAQLDSGILWNSAGINWPVETPLLSPRDLSFPTLAAYASPFRLRST